MEPKQTTTNNIETRAFDFRLSEPEEGIIVGHAALFDTWTDLGWFHERVARGAFSESLRSDDIRFLINHDGLPLGRTRSGTLQLAEDEHGLAVRLAPPDIQLARDLMTLIKRGDISQMSFAFKMLQDDWQYGERDGEPDKRTLTKVQLFDVSAVTFAAYPQTDLAVRSYERFKRQHQRSTGRTVASLRRRLKLKEVQL